MTQAILLQRRPWDRRVLLAWALAFVAQLAAPTVALAATATELAAQGRAGLQTLYAGSAEAKGLGKRAKAVLVFPNVVKAGAFVGGQTGEGVLFINDKASSFYRISAASVGYQLGAQRFSYALFFLTDSSIDHLKKTKGWAVGTGPSLVLIDSGKAKTMNTMTLDKEVYAMSFGQRGLMGGSGIEGSKITQIYPDAKPARATR